MEINEFKNIVDDLIIKNPVWFSLDRDANANEDEIKEAEKQLTITFPKDYKHFLSKYGGGYFAFTNIFSVNQGSEWNIAFQNNNIEILEQYDFLAVSDNELGDYYGYLLTDGKPVNSTIFFYNHDNKLIQETEFTDIFEYLIKHGLKS